MGLDVSAVIVTRGDVEISLVLDSLPREWQKTVWDNSAREDLAVYGRYAAIAECEHDLIYVQDDDCVLDPESIAALVDGYSPEHVTANMPQRFRDTGFYTDHCLVGFGAVFHRDLPARAFQRLRMFGEIDPRATSFHLEAKPPGIFNRTCDIVFTGLTPRLLLDLPYTDREFASAPNRMWRQESHVSERTRMLELVRQVRDA